MATAEFLGYRERSRDVQDSTELQVFGEKTYVDGAGSILRVRSADSTDEEVVVANGGYGFNLPVDYNAEVITYSLGSDTNTKFAMMTLPRDKQRQWEEGKGGIQHPTDPEKAIEFADDGVWLKDGTFFLGHDKAVKITVDGDKVTLDCGELEINANVNINGSFVRHNGTPIDDTHVHSGVERGGANTDNPVG